jgi:hypothetical protein
LGLSPVHKPALALQELTSDSAVSADVQLGGTPKEAVPAALLSSPSNHGGHPMKQMLSHAGM